jgi:hypothetical protein
MLSSAAAAQQVPADLTVFPPVPADYVPATTAWGDPDFRATWSIAQLPEAPINLQRPAAFGDRAWLTPQEFERRLTRARKTDASYTVGVAAKGTKGLEDWLRSTPFGRRTSLIVDPPSGRLPPMTAQGDALFKAGKTSWNDGQPIDWVSDLDPYERCVSRGFPASMLPFGSNNAMRVFQSPGFVAIELEMLGTRIIPIGTGAAWPSQLRGWLGQSRGHWEGRTLVIETANIRFGDGVTKDTAQRAAPPVRGFDTGTVPVGPAAHAVERLTMTGPRTIAYEVTYTDPDVFTAPWTAELEWTRDDGYQMFEYACHEGNQAIRNLIKASRAQRAKAAAGG